MNERIYQLQGQAKILAEQHIAHRKFDDVMEYRQVLYDTTMNKFAELIVQECVESIPADGHRGDFGRAVEFCQQQIKQHFGVE